MFDLTIVGHFAIDLISSPRIKRPQPTLGGPPTYSSIAAKKMGAEVSVISKVGGDFPQEYIERLVNENVDLSGLKLVSGALTTRFVLKYGQGKRRLQLKSRAPSIEPSDIPEPSRSKAVHVAPIANELSGETIGKLRGRTEILSLDPQGLVRRFDEEGNVKFGRMKDRSILRNIDIFKSSMSELCLVVGAVEMASAFKKIHRYGVRTIIATKGMKGSLLSQEGILYTIPTCKPKVLVDPTGAGDAFIGAFLAEYLRSEDVIWCACVGSAAASFVVEGIGPSRFGEKSEVYERASQAREKLRSIKL